VAFGTNCRSAPVPFIFLRHYCTQMRVDLFCFLDAAKFFWTTIALAPSHRGLYQHYRPIAVISWVEIPHRSSLPLHKGVVSFRSGAGARQRPLLDSERA
jgi:hypothetical protein